MGRSSGNRTGRILTFHASLSAVLVTTFVGTTAEAQQTPVFGGSEGRYFEHVCGPGRLLVGLRGSAGVLIDNIQAICARVDGAASFSDAMVEGPIFGSNRPQDQHVQCPQGHAVTLAAVALNDDHPQVGAIWLSCTELANRRDGGSTRIGIQGSGNLEGYDSGFVFVNATPGGPGAYLSCNGNYAIGIRGRAGAYLSAFGLLCGPRPTIAVDPNAGHTLSKHKRRPEIIDRRQPGDGGQSVSFPGATEPPRTLGKRKKRPPTSSPEMPAPVQTDQPVGVSVFTDSGIPIAQPPVEQAPYLPPSELIDGTYLTTLTISESRCFKDLRSTKQGMVEIKPRPGILIPLNQMNSVFDAPVVLNVQGLVVRQDVTIPISIGGSVPASFSGTFTPDGARFNIRFEAGSSICRIGGTIAGVRS